MSSRRFNKKENEMTREEYKQKLLEKFPGLDQPKPITFSRADRVLELLLQAYDFGKKSTDALDTFRNMMGMR